MEVAVAECGSRRKGGQCTVRGVTFGLRVLCRRIDTGLDQFVL